jgi:ribonucleoside-diphosphate reductase alpha chain
MDVVSKFVLMEHLAKRSGRHYDLRFRRPYSKMWDSFATKKEIPPDPGKRIILWKTTLHTEEDALLTGRIESGYGAGILKKVDGDECIIKKYKKYEASGGAHFIVEFKGKKLKGIYHFFHPQTLDKKYPKNAFMFFKGRDTTVKEQKSLSENSLSIARNRYFLEDENNWESFSKRVARAPASIEKEKEKYEEKFSEMVNRMDFLGGGRILRNSGREKGSMLNCFHLPCGDSIEEIGDFVKNSLILWSEGGGVGGSFSQLRPKGAPIKGKGGYSSGPVSFIEAANAVSKTIESGGARRAAALGSLAVSHPDIFDFIDAKIVEGKISNFNISVEVTNYFIDCVQNDADWILEFGGKPHRTVKAREIWDKIVSNMVAHAEPGILNYDNITENNSWYFAPVTGVNPCGEAVLEPYGSCDLGSIVLPNFVNNGGGTDWQSLKETIFLGVRFLDNILDVNKFTITKILENAKNSRRVGVGVMGLAEYLFKKRVRYGSKESLVIIEELMSFIRDNCYLASVQLAKEKGPFPKFDRDLYLASAFVKTLPKEVQTEIYNHGIRNVTLMAIAPTGTISLLPEVASSIEPLFAKSFIRRDRAGNRVYIHPLYESLIAKNYKVPSWFVDAYDLTPSEHILVQRVVQKFVDGAVSKTLNLPRETTKDQLSELLLNNLKYLKGVTVYVDGSKAGQILNRMTDGQVISYLKKNGKLASHVLTEDDVECNVCSKAREYKHRDYEDIKKEVMKSVLNKKGGS